MFCFPARDNFGVVIHWSWGSFFIFFAFDILLQTLGVLPVAERYAANNGMALIFSVLLALTWVCAIGALLRELALLLTCTTLAIGATIACPGYHYGSEAALKVAGYFFMVSTTIHTYTRIHTGATVRSPLVAACFLHVTNCTPCCSCLR